MRKLFLLSGLIVVIDQITKLAVKGFNIAGWSVEGMQRGQRMPLVGDILRLNFVENPGMAFGLDFGMPLLLGLFSIGAAVFLVYLIRQNRDHEYTLFHTALAIILGGAVGNLIDRVFYAWFYGYGTLFDGKVVDFLDLDLPDMSFFGLEITRFGYIFNIADTAVTVGIILLLLSYPKYQKILEERERVAKSEGQEEQNESERETTEGDVETRSTPYVAWPSTPPPPADTGSGEVDRDPTS